MKSYLIVLGSMLVFAATQNKCAEQLVSLNSEEHASSSDPDPSLKEDSGSSKVCVMMLTEKIVQGSFAPEQIAILFGVNNQQQTRAEQVDSKRRRLQFTRNCGVEQRAVYEATQEWLVRTKDLK